ncbi:hypothetical protein MPER_13933, partial [Moniliophthora perniciosa FA553]
MFRNEAFKKKLTACVVDEVHVIKDWKDEFRTDYNQLHDLRVISGSDIPWSGFTGTLSHEAFDVVFEGLGMDSEKPFWGIDVGTDRPNVEYVVQRIRP